MDFEKNNVKSISSAVFKVIEILIFEVFVNVDVHKIFNVRFDIGTLIMLEIYRSKYVNYDAVNEEFDVINHNCGKKLS